MSIGGCIVQASRFDFTPPELVNMIEHAGVNRVFQFGLTACDYLAHAKTGDPEPRLLGALKGLRQYTYAGISIPREWEDWGFDQDIPLTVRHNIFNNKTVLRTLVDMFRLHRGWTDAD
jgi:hypothetical protein